MKAFSAWLDDFFASYYRHRPVNATFIGVHDYDHCLPDYSESGVEGRAKEMRSLLERLRSLPDDYLNEAEALDRNLAEGFLEIEFWELESRHFHRGNPCLYTGEAIFGVLGLFLRLFSPLAHRIDSAVARLTAIPELLRQGRVNVQQAPSTWTRRAIRECEGAAHFLREGVRLLAEEESIDEPRFQEEANRAAGSFEELEQYLDSELVHHSKVTERRSSTSVAGGWGLISSASSAPCGTSSPREWCATRAE